MGFYHLRNHRKYNVIFHGNTHKETTCVVTCKSNKETQHRRKRDRNKTNHTFIQNQFHSQYKNNSLIQTYKNVAVLQFFFCSLRGFFLVLYIDNYQLIKHLRPSIYQNMFKQHSTLGQRQKALVQRLELLNVSVCIFKCFHRNESAEMCSMCLTNSNKI